MSLRYLGLRVNCCMKYRNSPAKLLGEGVMLYFIQHIPIMAGLVKKMLYFVQDYGIKEKFLAATAAIRSSNERLPPAQ